MTEALHTKYRPGKFEDVVGHKEIVQSIRETLANGTHAFMLSGPAGVGKTTLARIIANAFDADKGLIDIDGATYNGVEDMRRIQEATSYRAFNKSGRKAIIVDECHRLSGNAWDSILKAVEEPPAHVIWIFCTTNPTKVPLTIRTRCATFTLNSLTSDQLFTILDRVIARERIKLNEDVFNLIVREAHGSARKALVNLDMCRSAKTKREAARLLETALESDATIELCQFIVNGGPWAKAATLIKQLSKESPEGVRLIIVNYIGTALLNAKSDKEACFFLGLLDAFASPYNASENWAPLLISMGKVLYSSEETND